MAEAVGAGAALAWRLLATLEVGSILVATSALIAYTARVNLVRERRHRTANSFLLTNSTNALGQEFTRRLEAEGCTVRTHTNNATSVAEADKVDCLVVIGAESKAGLDGISKLVSEDVYKNLNTFTSAYEWSNESTTGSECRSYREEPARNSVVALLKKYMLLESLATRVKQGGSIAWACAGDTSGAYADAAAAFDAVIQASLRHIAKKSHCEPIWVGRCSSTERAVDKTLTKLLPCTTRQERGFSIRNAAHNISEYLSRWLKMVT